MRISLSMIEEKLQGAGFNAVLFGNGDIMLGDAKIYRREMENVSAECLYFCPDEEKPENACCAFFDEDEENLGAKNGINIKRSNFFDVYSAVNELFRKFSEWEMSLMKAVSNSCDINTLVSLSTDIFENSITVYDTAMRLIGAGSNREQFFDFYWVHLPGGQYLSSEFMESQKSIYLSSSGKRLDRTTIVSTEWCRVMISPIIVNNNVLGYLHIHLRERELSKNYFPLAETLASFIGYILERDIYRTELNYSAVIPVEILLGTEQNHALIEHCCNICGWNTGDRYQILIIKSLLCAPDLKQNLPHYRYALRTVFDNSLLSVLGNDILLILHGVGMSDLSEAKMDALRHFLQGNRLKLGCSMEFENFHKVSNYYKQAVSALEFSEAPVSFYQGHLHDHMISMFDEQCDGMEYIHPFIKKLSRNDPNGILRKTLMQYLMCDKSYMSCAEALNIHKSTLKYRLDKIKDILEDDSYLDSGLRIDILLSLKLSIKSDGKYNRK